MALILGILVLYVPFSCTISLCNLLFLNLGVQLFSCRQLYVLCASYALVQATVGGWFYVRLGGTCQLNPVPAEGREGDLTYPDELWRRLRRRIRRRAVALRWTDGTMCAAAPPRDTC